MSRSSFAGRFTAALHHFPAMLFVACLVGLGLRVAYVLTIGRDLELGLDSIWYLLVGGGIAEGAGYVDPQLRFETGRQVATANFPPLYPLVVASVRAVAGTSITAVQLAGAVTGTATVLLTGLIGKRIAGPRVGVAAAGLAAIYPSLIASDASVMSETVFVPLMLGGVLALLHATDAEGIRWWLVAGLLFGLAALARSEGLVLGAVLVAGVILADRRASRQDGTGISWTRPAVAIGVMVAVLAPWSIYASIRLDSVVITSTATDKTLAGANCDPAWSGAGTGGWENRCVVDRTPAGADEIERSRAWRRAALDYVSDNAGRAPVVVTARAARTLGLWSPSELVDAEQVESRQRRWQGLAWIVWIVTLPAALAGLVLLAQRNLPIWPIVSTLVGVVALGVMAWGNQRFRIVAEPLVLITAASAGLGLVHLLPGTDRP